MCNFWGSVKKDKVASFLLFWTATMLWKYSISHMETSWGEAMRLLAIARINWSAISHLESRSSNYQLGNHFPSTSKSLGYACSWAERAPRALEKALRQKSQEKQDSPSRWDAVSIQELPTTALAEIRVRLKECDRVTKSIYYTWKLPNRWLLCILYSVQRVYQRASHTRRY